MNSFPCLVLLCSWDFLYIYAWGNSFATQTLLPSSTQKSILRKWHFSLAQVMSVSCTAQQIYKY